MRDPGLPWVLLVPGEAPGDVVIPVAVKVGGRNAYEPEASPEVGGPVRSAVQVLEQEDVVVEQGKYIWITIAVDVHGLDVGRRAEVVRRDGDACPGRASTVVPI